MDRDRGRQIDVVVQVAAEWASENCVIPVDWNDMMTVVSISQARGEATVPTRRMATLYAVLGLYDRALTTDRWILRSEPTDGVAAHRVGWSLTQLRRFEEAYAAALEFEAGPLGPSIGGAWSKQMQSQLSFDAMERGRRAMRTPLLTIPQQHVVQLGRISAPARVSKRGRSAVGD